VDVKIEKGYAFAFFRLALQFATRHCIFVLIKYRRIKCSLTATYILFPILKHFDI